MVMHPRFWHPLVRSVDNLCEMSVGHLNLVGMLDGFIPGRDNQFLNHPFSIGKQIHLMPLIFRRAEKIGNAIRSVRKVEFERRIVSIPDGISVMRWEIGVAAVMVVRRLSLPAESAAHIGKILVDGVIAFCRLPVRGLHVEPNNAATVGGFTPD